MIKEKSNRLDHEIEQILFRRKASTLGLNECDVVLRSLFPEDDVQIIMGNLTKEVVEEERGGSKQPENRKASKSVAYGSFVNQILERNLVNYQKRTEKFLREFKKADADSDGLISEQDLISLLRRLFPKDSK